VARKADFGRIVCHRADLGSDEELAELVDATRRDLGRLDLLVHCAGVIYLGDFSSAAVDDLDHQYRINVRAAYLLTQSLLPDLIDAKGQVVFVNSSAGTRAQAGVSQYSATKHALRAIADSLRAEVNDKGVRVLSVFPVRTATSMQVHIHESEGRRYEPDALLQPPDVAGAILSALSMPRTAEVTEIHLRPAIPPATI
jgi:NADP-dependent 3-hydroxy acid dehydrogenase YdfG